MAGELLQLCRELFASRDLDQIVERVLDFSLECLPTYVAAGVILSGSVLPARQFVTDAVADQLQTPQVETGQGPSMLAFESPDPVHVATFDRWPQFAARAAELGTADVLAYSLSVPVNGAWLALGSLTFYGEAEVMLDDEAPRAGVRVGRLHRRRRRTRA